MPAFGIRGQVALLYLLTSRSLVRRIQRLHQTRFDIFAQFCRRTKRQCSLERLGRHVCLPESVHADPTDLERCQRRARIGWRFTAEAIEQVGGFAHTARKPGFVCKRERIRSRGDGSTCRRRPWFTVHRLRLSASRATCTCRTMMVWER